MNYVDEWRNISARIKGLMEAGKLHAQFSSIYIDDPYNRKGQIESQCRYVFKGIQEYVNNFSYSIPAESKVVIDAFVKKNESNFHSKTIDNFTTSTLLVSLSTFETQLTYLFSNSQESIKAITERAFHHLNRTIIVDGDIKQKWNDAFDKGETECEKLGAVHLLSHGIWAFKADATGARTDLVYQEPARMNDREFGVMEGLVLTEWKLYREKKNLDELINNAVKQAKRYKIGVLGGNELRDCIYIVIVSEKEIPIPDPRVEDSVTFRFVNIIVDPDIPSKPQKIK